MESALVGEVGTQSMQNTEIGARTAKVATSVLLGKVIVFVLAGASFIIVARLLGPSTYGIYTLAIAIIGIFGSVGDLGIGVSFNKFIPEYMSRNEHLKIKELLANGYAMLLLFGGILTILTFALSGVFSTYIFHSAAYSGLIEIASFLILLSILYGDSYSALIGFGKNKGIAVTATVEAAAQSSVSIALAVLGFGAAAPIIGLVAGYGFGIVSALMAIRGFTSRSSGVSVSVQKIRELLKFSLPVGISNIMGAAVSSISLVVLGLFATSIVVGNFGVASRTGSMIDLITGSISVSLITMYSTAISLNKSHGEISRFYNYSLYLAFVLIAPLLFFVGILSTPFSYTVFSGVYKLAPVYISIMAFGILIGLFSTYAYNLMISAKRVNSVLKYSAATAAVQFVLLPFLVPVLKGVGLALLMFVVAPIVGDVLYAYGLSRVLYVNVDFWKVGRVLLANVISFAFVVMAMLVLKDAFIPVLIVSAALVLLIYPPVLSLVGALKRKDVEIIKRTAGDVPIVGAAVNGILSYASLFTRG